MNNAVNPTTEPIFYYQKAWQDTLDKAHEDYVKLIEKEFAGKTFGRLVFKRCGGKNTKKTGYVYLFDCICGRKDVPRDLNFVLRGIIKTCGCRMGAKTRLDTEDLTGRRFGKLTVKNRINEKPVKWQCTCDCGGSKEVRTYFLKRGLTTHCGCERKYHEGRRVMFKHGETELSITDWARILGTSRQRAHQLYKSGKLTERITSLIK